jgi:hypothetical protein
MGIQGIDIGIDMVIGADICIGSIGIIDIDMGVIIEGIAGIGVIPVIVDIAGMDIAGCGKEDTGAFWIDMLMGLVLLPPLDLLTP